MTESSDDIIVLSDDDDVKIESVITPKSQNNSYQVRTNRTTTTTLKHRAPILVLTEPKSLSYGIERGYKLKHIHGLKRVNIDENDLMYLVEYELCDDYEFVPSNVLRKYCNEDILINYLEKLTQLTD
ncbi:unnamed protein product [Adineta steineri]|uniref:Uncharacterized protein n=1 Tax=Adineta steineri TaxID=433720 RepID=A0A814QHD9_9BILA|nr:unnamed protein product [Adineta steineri]